MEVKQDFSGIIIFLLMYIAVLAWWFRARLGYHKGWFVAPLPVISRSGYFALPIASVGFLIGLASIVVSEFQGPISTILFFLAIGFILLSYVIAYIEPKWMAPKWYRWLKENHSDIMPYLVLDAHEMGRQVWKERVETQAGLEDWAEEVRRKYRR